ncbi:hypothetical protein L207DRAFT_517670 [Hyaloscypha variabilis F]|uniref:AAA+ ATPase domain-containing protein n=1 Tax=Hyaloscypha variabilis (strain UAMH 11265 / GT02V1 / F) TaxID=1149755 RepID=A0A2J6R511_HYAVF|nr:hypothetical protein L207DRAFT_517670 [Hyaloscypha variabilis F]
MHSNADTTEDTKMDSEQGSRVDLSTEIDEDEEHGKSLYPGQMDVKIIPEVCKCDLLHFKNRFNAAEDGLYAVDVLETDPALEQEEIQEERRVRQSLPKSHTKSNSKASKSSEKLLPKGKPSKSTSKPSPSLYIKQSDGKFISRIRIQSPTILLILSKIMQESWGSQPRTFIRPFSPLIYFHPQVLGFLRELELKWGRNDETCEGGRTPRTPASLDGASGQIVDAEKISVGDSAAALAELKCYVEFMSNEIMPLYSQFDHLDDTSNTTIRFQDLWYLFRNGDMIYRSVGGGAIQETNDFSLGHRAWRLFAAGTGFMPSHNRYHISDDDAEQTSFELDCYYIDYTGEEFCVVTETFEIHAFEGERPINSLKLFPYRFLANHKERLGFYTQYGQKFLSSIEERHRAYNWWTVTRTPRGDPTTDAEGNDLKRSEYVDSEVIIDFVEAFQTCPSWKPVASILKPQEPRRLTVIDDFYTCWWSDANRTTLLAETTEIIVLRAGVSTYERNKNLLEDKFLAKVRENDKNNRLTTSEYLSECDLPLLPSRVFGYVLRDRKFVQLDVYGLRPVKESSDGFDCLKINRRYKDLIKALVEDHFMKKTSDRQDGVTRTSLDWIKGKGKGLFILLHGVPGVGKTATAEAVAQASGKPLFAITCGDLGLTPTEVESALRRIFRLANTWDCVLLLDEVDTFFSQRSKGDVTLTKNALVSVFLRVLEYYDGLLFLTTNRPGALDEAFKSRIHLTLYYPPLDLQQTMDIWKMNIDRLRKVEKERCMDTDLHPLQINEQEILRLAEEKFYEYKGKFRWNGRQIRNAIQIASSLAHFDARKDDIQPRLTTEHFKMIHVVTEDFDHFMQETVGKTDGEMAFERGDRADHWSPEQTRGGEVSSYDPGAVSPGRGRLGGGMIGLGRQQPSTTGRRQSSPFDRNQDESSNFLGLRIPSPNRLAKQRPLLGRPPAILFNNEPESEFGHRPRSRGKAYLNEHRLSNGELSPDDTNSFEQSGGNFGSRKRGREASESEDRAWFKRRRESDFEDQDNTSS